VQDNRPETTRPNAKRPDERHPDPKRLAWACRRGMLELDIPLQHFLNTAYRDLPEADQQRFSALLELPDVQLQRYFNGDEQSPDAPLQRLIEKIRNCLGNPPR